MNKTSITRPKLRFPTCPELPKHDISYTYLAEDKAKFYANEMCRKSYGLNLCTRKCLVPPPPPPPHPDCLPQPMLYVVWRASPFTGEGAGPPDYAIYS